MPVPYLETFKQVPEDSNIGIAAVPSASSTVSVTGISELSNTDLIESFDFNFRFDYTPTITGTANLSPMFPYNHVGQLTAPYQSGNLKAFDADGHAAWYMNWLRSPWRVGNKYGPSSLLGDQKSLLATGYTAMDTTAVSSGSYTIATATEEKYKFTLTVPYGLWFDTYYDYQPDGKIVPYNEVFVSPLVMSASGRAIKPVVKLNPLTNATVDLGPTAGATTLTSTDHGSVLDIRRTGWREPAAGKPVPRFFNWAYKVVVSRYSLPSAKKTITITPEGQLLSLSARMFDPTLTTIAATVGDVIPLANLTEAELKFGSGIVKYDDDQYTHKRRVLEQFGSIPTEGMLIFDMYGPSRSNCPGEVLNPLTTAGVSLLIDLGSNVPGAGSYVDVIQEMLVLVR